MQPLEALKETCLQVYTCPSTHPSTSPPTCTAAHLCECPEEPCHSCPAGLRCLLGVFWKWHGPSRGGTVKLAVSLRGCLTTLHFLGEEDIFVARKEEGSKMSIKRAGSLEVTSTGAIRTPVGRQELGKACFPQPSLVARGPLAWLTPFWSTRLQAGGRATVRPAGPAFYTCRFSLRVKPTPAPVYMFLNWGNPGSKAAWNALC